MPAASPITRVAPGSADFGAAHIDVSALSDAQRAQWREDGYLVIKGVVTPAGLKQLRAECGTAWRTVKGSEGDVGELEGAQGKSWLFRALVPRVHHFGQLVRDLYWSSSLVDIAVELCGPDLKAVGAQLSAKMAGNTQTFGWHQDNGYGELANPDCGIYMRISLLFVSFSLSKSCCSSLSNPGHALLGPLQQDHASISMLMALDDTSLENGALRVLPGSHKRGQVR